MAAPAPSLPTSSKSTFIWKNDSRAGDIPAHIYHGSRNTKEQPIAIIYHAGGFVMGSTDIIAGNQIDYLVSKGFVVATPEYRLAAQIDLVNGPQQDAKDFYLWAQQELPGVLKKSSGVEVDISRIVCIGQSAGAFLALSTGILPNPPRAIVDFYGVKYLEDDFYKQPLAAFAQIPTLPEAFINKVFDGPVPVTSKPMFVDGKPALDNPRAAWYITQLKNGTSISSILPKEKSDFEITKHFGSRFPPTFFLHGKGDIFVSSEFSIRANTELTAAGNESAILLGDDITHMFDLTLDVSDPKFEKYVKPALDFAIAHV